MWLRLVSPLVFVGSMLDSCVVNVRWMDVSLVGMKHALMRFIVSTKVDGDVGSHTTTDLFVEKQSAKRPNFVVIFRLKYCTGLIRNNWKHNILM